MKLLLPLSACLLTLALAATAGAQTATAPKSSREKLGYALGAEVGANLKQAPIDFDPQFFIAAVRDTLTGGQMQMAPDQMRDTLMAFQRDMQAKQKDAQAKQLEGNKAASDKNKKDGDAFLAANKSKAGVQTLADGMQYKVLKDGTGPVPTATDTVTVKYRGTLVDGTEFDSSDKQPGGTATFPVNGVIPGWTEALQKMKTGSKWQLAIPSALAYGASGAPGSPIGPDTVLVFDVELVAIAAK